MAAELSTRNRAKVYQLNAGGQWDDRGTGYAACQFLQAYGFACIILVSEDDSAPILETRVSPDNIYQRQGDTIISWTEPANNCDVALSFADSTGCSELWELICNLQRTEAQTAGGGFALGDAGGTHVGQGHLGGLLSLSHEHGPLGGGLNHEMGPHEVTVDLPAPELRNVIKLAETLSEITFYQRPAVVQILLQQDYVSQLAALFQTVEDLESLPELHAMFHIFRTLMMLNDTAVFEQLLRDDVVMNVIGALEYDPELLAHATRHREFLTSVVEFKEVLPIREPAILARIHQNFRVQYIKDVVLPRSLDDNTFATLNSLVFVNNVAILTHIQADADYLQQLFIQLLDSAQPLLRRRELSRLLLELCQLARNLQLFNRASFYRRLLDFGLFTPVASLLMSGDSTLQLNVAEMLGASCLHDPSMLRQFILSERPAQQTMSALMHVLTCGAEAGVKAQLAEVLRALLDPETMEGLEQEEFLNFFYEHFIPAALAPLESAGADDGDAPETSTAVPAGRVKTGFSLKDGAGSLKTGGSAAAVVDGEVAAAAAAVGADAEAAAAALGDSPAGLAAKATFGAQLGSGEAGGGAEAASLKTGAEAEGSLKTGAAADGEGAALKPLDEEALHSSRSLVVELLCFCVLHHGYRIKYFVLKNHVMAKVLRLCQLRDKPLILAAVRFMRACVGLKDEFYLRYIAKNEQMLPLIEQLAANAWLDNLLSSAIIELLEFIRKENLRSLLAHLYDSHKAALDAVRLPDLDLVQGLWLRHQQNLEGAGATQAVVPERRAEPNGKGRGFNSGRPTVGAAFAGIEQGGSSHRQDAPTRVPRRAPPGGSRAFNDDDDSSYFDGSDGEDEIVPSDTGGRAAGGATPSAGRGGFDSDDRSAAAAAAAAVAAAAVAEATGNVLAYGTEPGALSRFGPRRSEQGDDKRPPAWLPSSHFDPSLAAAHGALRHAHAQGNAEGALHDVTFPARALAGSDSPGHGGHESSLHLPAHVDELPTPTANTNGLAPWALGGEDNLFGRLSRSPAASPSPKGSPLSHVRRAPPPLLPGAGADLPILPSAEPSTAAATDGATGAQLMEGIREESSRPNGSPDPSIGSPDGAGPGPVGAKRPREQADGSTLPPAGAPPRDEPTAA